MFVYCRSGVLIINQPKIHNALSLKWMLYYCWLLIQTDTQDKICTVTSVYNVLQYNHNKVNN